MTEALRAGEKEKLIVLRGLKSVLKYAQIDKGDELTDQEVITALSGQAKRAKDSIEQFAAGGRDDLVQNEKFGLNIIQTYLPDPLSDDKVREIVKTAIDDCGAESAKDLGKIMQLVMPQVKGQADGKLVKKLAMEFLAK